jgi:hypothetical protein
MVGTGLPRIVMQFVFPLACQLNVAGDPEGALALAEWAERRQRVQENLYWAPYGSAELAASRFQVGSARFSDDLPNRGISKISCSWVVKSYCLVIAVRHSSALLRARVGTLWARNSIDAVSGTADPSGSSSSCRGVVGSDRRLATPRNGERQTHEWRTSWNPGRGTFWGT